MKTKGLVFIGSRANFGRLYMVLKEMEKNSDWLEFKIFLAASGTYIDLGEFKRYVDYSVDGVMYKDNEYNIAQTMSIIQSHASNYFKSNRYDFTLIHGDRFENCAFALAAFFSGVPIYHTEGGESSGGFDDTTRDVISQLSTVHLPTTKYSYIALKDNYNHNKISLVGSPTIDYVFDVLERRKQSNKFPYAVVLYNPLPGENHKVLIDVVLELVKGIDIYWVNPNVDPGFKDLVYDVKKHKINFIKDLNPDEYIRLLDQAHFLIGNTSSGIKEGAAIGVPYVMIGDRQKNREVSNNVYRIDMHKDKILEQCNILSGLDKTRITYDGRFGNGDASKKIVETIKKHVRK